MADAADAAPVADNHGAWLKFAPSCMSDAQWEVAAKTPEAVLSHRSCPWGGHLIKIDSKSIFIQQAPEDPTSVLVRPEVRAMAPPGASGCDVDLQCLETFAPGDALMQRRNSMWILRLSEVLFGSCHHFFADRIYHKLPVVTQYRLYKDFPEPGDCTYFALEGLWTMRRVPGSASHYRSVLVMSTPEDKWPAWASPLFPAFTLMLHSGAERMLNCPSMRDMRAIDANMYLVLSLRSFNRGHPMIPTNDTTSEESFNISAGEHLGLVSWTRFKSDEKFHLREYMRCFMERLGHQLKTYEVMDGRQLAHYQCVVVRQEWEQVRMRTSFRQVFKVQKAAYRRANGGVAAPSLVEDAAPHFVLRDFSFCAQPQAIQTVVRKTFIELEGSDDSSGCLKRSNSTGEVMAYFV